MSADDVVQLNPATGKRDEELVWVYFWPNGGIAKIDHKPEQLSPYDWFTIMNEEAALVYTPLTQTSRGYWRLPRQKFASILARGAAAPASKNPKADCCPNWSVGDTRY
jgi:hypothetical protein